MKAIYNKPIYEGGIIECGRDRLIMVSERDYLNIPVGANYVIVKRMPRKRSRKIEVYYQRWLPGTDGPEMGLGSEEFLSGLMEIIIRELKNLKTN